MTLPIARIEPKTTADRVAVLRSRSRFPLRIVSALGIVAISSGIAIATIEGCIGKASRVRDPRTTYRDEVPSLEQARRQAERATSSP